MDWESVRPSPGWFTPRQSKKEVSRPCSWVENTPTRSASSGRTYPRIALSIVSMIVLIIPYGFWISSNGRIKQWSIVKLVLGEFFPVKPPIVHSDMSIMNSTSLSISLACTTLMIDCILADFGGEMLRCRSSPHSHCRVRQLFYVHQSGHGTLFPRPKYAR
jgi:hypothetical protein